MALKINLFLGALFGLEKEERTNLLVARMWANALAFLVRFRLFATLACSTFSAALRRFRSAGQHPSKTSLRKMGPHSESTADVTPVFVVAPERTVSGSGRARTGVDI